MVGGLVSSYLLVQRLSFVMTLLGPFIKDVGTKGEGGWPKRRHSKGDCVDLVLEIWQNADKGREGVQNTCTFFMNGPQGKPLSTPSDRN